jgi:hypothetical protein
MSDLISNIKKILKQQIKAIKLLDMTATKEQGIFHNKLFDNIDYMTLYIA